MSVVGIDFGVDTCYISVARAGGIEVIANDYSMRDSPSFVGFSNRQRIMAVGAKNQLLTNLKRTFFGFKLLLGRKFDDPVVQGEASNLPYPISKGPDGGILIHVDYDGKVQEFSPEQITAMLFTKLKETADAALQTKVKDVVISVPNYYTDSERRALLDAATIAGLNVLKLMNDLTATALAYGIYKQDLPATEEKARNVVFVDCGHSGTQVASCSFNKGKLVMQTSFYARNCGGRAFNELLANYFADEFKNKFKVDAHTNKKALIKLTSEVEKIKKQMSANTNKLPLNIECFMDDKDVRGSVDRATFEELAAPLFQNIEEVLRNCLTASKWKPEDIYSVEIIGGSTRVPAIKGLIEKVFGKTPNTTLNADEAVSRGCALQCAILSPTFKVREFSVTDIQPYPIKLRWQAESDQGDMVVFPQFHAVPFSKMLTFYRREAFTVEAEYDGSAPVANQHIGVFEIGEVRPNEDGTNQKVKVKVRVNLNGIFTVASASMSEKHEIEEEVPMEVDQKEEKAAAAATGDEKTEGGTDKAADKNEEPMEADAKEPPKMEKRKKTVQKTIDLPITPRVVGSLSRDKLEAAINKEKGFVAADLQESERLNSKNSVEEYLYDIRAKIHDELESFIKEEDRSKFSMELEDAENWLYEDGEDCDKNVYIEKLKEMKLKGEPIKKRKSEFEQRPSAIEALGHCLQMADKIVEMFKAGDEKYDHLDPVEMEKVSKLIGEKRKWMDESCSVLGSLPKTTNPPVLAVQFFQEKQAFETTAYPIINRSKPKPPKQDPPPPAEAAGEKKGDDKTAGDANAPEAAQAAPASETAGVNGAEAEQGNMDLD